MKFLVTFDSVQHALRAEKMLRDIQITTEMIPTPREISASCGQSLRFQEDVIMANILSAFNEAHVRYQKVFAVFSGRRYEEVASGTNPAKERSDG